MVPISHRATSSPVHNRQHEKVRTKQHYRPEEKSAVLMVCVATGEGGRGVQHRFEVVLMGIGSGPMWCLRLLTLQRTRGRRGRGDGEGAPPRACLVPKELDPARRVDVVVPHRFLRDAACNMTSQGRAMGDQHFTF